MCFCLTVESFICTIEGKVYFALYCVEEPLTVKKGNKKNPLHYTPGILLLSLFDSIWELC